MRVGSDGYDMYLRDRMCEVGWNDTPQAEGGRRKEWKIELGLGRGEGGGDWKGAGCLGGY